MKPLHPLWICSQSGLRNFKYIPSWETMKPGYLEKRFRKIRKEMAEARKQSQESSVYLDRSYPADTTATSGIES